jgi:hypothetical protein
MRFPILILWCAAFAASGATHVSDGSISDINTKIAGAVAGDIVTIPAGTYNNYGASGAAIQIDKAVEVQGDGSATTIFNLAADADYPFQIVSGGSGAIFKGFTVNQAGRNLMSVQNADGWRLTDVKYVDPLSGSHPYVLYIENAHGLIDNCTFTLFTEQVFIRGKSDAWQTADQFGTTNAVVFEDCLFDGASGGYTDGNANARVVHRFNRIDSQLKFDMHGKHSSTPRGGRLSETYSNVWTSAGANYTAIELRSGTDRTWGNRAPNAASPSASPWLIRQEYWVVDGTYDSGDYPIDDQIGVGMDPKAAASSPAYEWGNVRGAATRWNWEIYSTPMTGVIENDRDVFTEVASFNGSSGVGIGTRAQMDAITPSLTGVGFWVTDEGEWNADQAGADGRLYVWSGAAWVLNYTPLQYPHPLRASSGAGDTPAAGAKVVVVGPVILRGPVTVR